jgi:hypothetical protein
MVSGRRVAGPRKTFLPASDARGAGKGSTTFTHNKTILNHVFSVFLRPKAVMIVLYDGAGMAMGRGLAHAVIVNEAQ